MLVPNRFPSIQSTKKLALIGEAPGADEDARGIPFCGVSGRFLAALLSRAGISIEQVFLGNISQHRPAGNDFSTFAWDGPQVQHGLATLKNDLLLFEPNVVVLLGNAALKAAKDVLGNGKKYRFSNTNWRGSFFLCDDSESPFYGRKCTTTYHPAYCLRDYDATPFLQLDLRRAVTESVSPELILPNRNIVVPSTFSDGMDRLRELRKEPFTSCDIEGYWNNIWCIGFAPNPEYALVVPFVRKSGHSYWKPQEEVRFWKEVAELMYDQRVAKGFTAGLYDLFCLHFGYGIVTRNIAEDSMVKHWSLYSELAKDVKKKKSKKGMGLAIQASIYTKEPYYKGELDSEDDATRYRYNGKDCCVTTEVILAIQDIFKGDGLGEKFSAVELSSMETLYRFDMKLYPLFLSMMLRGIRYDIAKARVRCTELTKQASEVQARLNRMTGYGFQWKTLKEVTDRAGDLMLVIKKDRPRKKYLEKWARFKALLNLVPTVETITEIEDLCEVSLNIENAKQIVTFLYEEIKLPIQMSNVRGEEPHPTADYEALLNLSRICQKEKKYEPYLPILQAIIVLRALSTRSQMLQISADNDGRIRCGYNIVGSNTGRITCYESPTGSGYNLQTIPNYTNTSEAPGGVLGDRDLFLADEDHWFFQCDLSGADGWTVAAYSAMLGDDTMLKDYGAGVSPFKILTLMLRGLKVPEDRGELYAAVKIIGKDDWDRFAMKRVQHGGCYLEGGLTISRNILKDSEGKLYLSPAECDKMKQYFFTRYWGVKRWHDWVSRRIRERPVLIAASGQVRQFFGRPDEILTKAVAFEPQANTTYATNFAMFRLWTDSENRVGTNNPSVSDGSVSNGGRVLLRIEPLHQVHDALCGQFRKADTPWALTKIKSYFDNPLTIAGQQITIPFEGGYGPSWGELPNKI